MSFVVLLEIICLNCKSLSLKTKMLKIHPVISSKLADKWPEDSIYFNLQNGTTIYTPQQNKSVPI